MNGPAHASGRGFRPSVLMVWKVVEYAGLVAFVGTVPRLMGAARYGRFAALLSTTAFLVSAASLGGLATFGRFAPQYVAHGEWSEVNGLFVRMARTRLALATLLAVGLVALLPTLLPGATAWTCLAAAGALIAGATATACYQLFYGLNVLGRWIVQDSLARILLLVLLVLIGGAVDLGRAVTALLLTNVAFLSLGAYWTRSFLVGPRPPFDWRLHRSQIGLGGAFFGAGLVLMGVWRGGEALILLSSQAPSEAAHFSIANAATMAAAILLAQIALFAAPSFTRMRVVGDRAGLDAACGTLARYLTIAAFLMLLIAYGFAEPVVRGILGEEYLPVAGNLRVLALGLPPAAILGVGQVRAVVLDLPGRLFQVHLAALATFALVASANASHLGALEMSSAVTAALTVGAVLACWRLDLLAILARARFGRLLGFGLLVVAGVAAPFAAPVARTVVGLVAFVASLLLAGVARPDELRRLVRGRFTTPVASAEP